MSKPPTRRKKSLTTDDVRVWRHVASSIKPLDERRALPEDDAPLPAPPEPPAVAVRPAPPPPLPKKPSLPPIAPIERRLRQAIVRGREEVNARLDLHGHTQDSAHRALFSFLRRSQSQGHKLVIVITGKGSAGRYSSLDEGYHPHPGLERGVLKRMVPLWLGLPEFRTMVLGFENAHAFHGGEGALYVRLRKSRS